MGCPSNPKKFLGLISYEGDHVWRLLSLEFMTFWIAKYECEQCHAQKEVWPLRDVDIIRMGFDIEALREQMGHWNSIHGEKLQALRESND